MHPSHPSHPSHPQQSGEFRSNSLPVYGYTGGAQYGSFSGAEGPGGRHAGARAASFIEANRMLAVARAENLDRHPNVKARASRQTSMFSSIASIAEIDTGKYALTTLQQLGYCVGHVMNDMCACVWFTYLIVFLTRVAGLTSSNAGYVFMAGQGADGIATPIVGYLSDHSKGCRPLGMGRRKWFHFTGTLCVIVCFLGVFAAVVVPDMAQAPTTAYYSFAAALFNVGWAAVQVAHMAMVPELSDNPAEKLLLNSGRYAFTIFSNVLVFILFLLFVQFIPPTSDLSKMKFVYLALLCVIIGAVCTFWFNAATPEKKGEQTTSRDSHLGAPLLSDQESTGTLDAIDENRGSEELAAARDKYKKTIEVGDTWKSWFFHAPFYQVGWLYMMARLIVNVSQVYIPVYVLDVVDMSSTSVAVVPMVVYIASLLATMSMEKITTRLGKYWAFQLGCVLVLIGCAHMLFATSSMNAIVYSGSIMFGLGNAIVMVQSVNMESDLIGEKVNTGAFVYGALSFTDKMSNGIVILLIQIMQEPLEDEDNDDDPCHSNECANYVRYILTLVPAAAAVSAMLVCGYMSWFKTLN